MSSFFFFPQKSLFWLCTRRVSWRVLQVLIAKIGVLFLFSSLFMTISQPENTFHCGYKQIVKYRYFNIHPIAEININITKAVVAQ